MPFTPEQIAAVGTATLDYHLKGQPMVQNLQARPLIAALRENQDMIPGGANRQITVRVKALGGVSMAGFTGDDELSFDAPANAKTATFQWADHHAGIKFTREEMLRNGISIVDGTADSAVVHSDAEKVALFNLLKDRSEELTEGVLNFLQRNAWGDGSADPLAFAGIRSFILADPTANLNVGGINQAANPWWRNRALVGANAIKASTATASDGVLVRTLDRELVQLRRFRKSPKHKIFAGSDAIEQLRNERFAKGIYTQSGFTGAQNLSMGDVSIGGVPVVYDPTLDDIGMSKYLFVLDFGAIRFKVVSGEDLRTHNPERAFDRFVFYRSATIACGITVDCRNSSGIYAIE